jgi:hypothetical protein
MVRFVLARCSVAALVFSLVSAASSARRGTTC